MLIRPASTTESNIPLAAPPPAGREADASPADFLPPRRRANPAAYLKTPLKPDKITAIGDSVMVGAADELTGTISSLDLDAALGRQAPAAIELLRTRRAAGELGAVVILHLGSNGAFSGRQLDDVMAVLLDARRVVMVNVKAPRQWETQQHRPIGERETLSADHARGLARSDRGSARPVLGRRHPPAARGPAAICRAEIGRAHV